MKSRLSSLILRGCLVTACCGAGPRIATAQSSQTFEVGIQLPVSRFVELDSTDVGIGGRAAWQRWDWLGVEGELNFYPRDIPPGLLTYSQSRFEGLFGITAGPRLERWRPFVRIRPGFLQVASSPEPLACALVFPPTDSCALAAGETLFTLDLGGGIELSTPGRTFVRFDIGDQMLRFPGPARDHDNQVHDDNFYRHELRLAIGGGWRF